MKNKILSEREWQVAQLIAQGFSYKEIGKRLYISANTVTRHRDGIISKISIDNIDKEKYDTRTLITRFVLLGPEVLDFNGDLIPKVKQYDRDMLLSHHHDEKYCPYLDLLLDLLRDKETILQKFKEKFPGLKKHIMFDELNVLTQSKKAV